MSIKKTQERFSKPGKGFPQVEQLNSDGSAVLDKSGKPVIGNEQYIADQLTEDSISSESAKDFMADVLEAVDGDLAKAAECFRTGWNRVTRINSAGLDEYQKAAKNILKLKLPMGKGLSIDELADKLRTMNS